MGWVGHSWTLEVQNRLVEWGDDAGAEEIHAGFKDFGFARGNAIDSGNLVARGDAGGRRILPRACHGDLALRTIVECSCVGLCTANRCWDSRRAGHGVGLGRT